MSAKPIDLQATIPKTQQLSRIRQIENNMHRNNMHNQVASENNHIKKKLNRVNNSEKTGYKKIDKERQNNKDKKQEQGSKKKIKKQNCEEKDNNKNPKIILGRSIDIKI